MKSIDKNYAKIGLVLATIYISLFGSYASADAETPELSKAVFYVH